MFRFIPEDRPFPHWFGPFSPAHGTYSGFRINRGRCGTWVESAGKSSFWELEQSEGADALSALMMREWGGGRVLLLPNGFAVKPLQSDSERGTRILIGRFDGPLVLVQQDGGRFDLSRTSLLQPGDPWPGPKGTGLECALHGDGTLTCSWFEGSMAMGQFVTKQLRGPDAALSDGFRQARPGEVSGRVRVTANGAVITNRRFSDAAWNALYIGLADRSTWPDWSKWINRPRG